MKTNITFVVFTYNEEKRVPWVIENLKWFWDILIIDNFSTDNTKIIAEELWVKVVQYKNPGYVETKEELEFVKSNINTEYMTWSFCDWVWPKPLLEKILKVTNENIVDCIHTIQYNYHYWIENLNFLTFFWGFWKEKLKWFDVVFKKRCIKIDWIIHSNLKIDWYNRYRLPREKIYFIHHLSVYNIKKFELSHSKYSEIESEMLYKSWIKSSLIKTSIKILYLFVKYYFIEWWWKTWKTWFIMIMQYMFFYFNVWAKHYELENNISIESIETKYSKIRLKILEKL